MKNFKQWRKYYNLDSKGFYIRIFAKQKSNGQASARQEKDKILINHKDLSNIKNKNN